LKPGQDIVRNTLRMAEIVVVMVDSLVSGTQG
jgi:hypothetical protein